VRLHVAVCVVLAGCPAPAPSTDFEPALPRLIVRFGTVRDVDDSNFELRRVRAALRAGRLGINLTLLEACLQQRAPYPDVFNDIPVQPIPRECVGLWVPRSKAGEACDTGLGCIEGFCLRSDFSRSSVAGACGICQPRQPLGGVCDGHGWLGADLQCKAGLACIEGLCAPPPALHGESGACPCAEGFRCSGACRRIPQLDDVCIAGTDDCAHGLFCDGRLCRGATEGTPCGGAPEVCGDALGCVTPPFGSATCLRRTIAGGACVGSEQCPPAHQCSDGTCVRSLAPGEPCGEASSACMEGTSCVSGRCSRRPQLNEPCLDSCARGVCVDGVCSNGLSSQACDARPQSDVCGVALRCEQTPNGAGSCCSPEHVLGEPCLATGGRLPPCDFGLFCSAKNQCADVCVLGDGRARGDFFGRPEAPGACLLTGPAAQVRVLSDEEAACVFDDASCFGCHRLAGCAWELRPRSPPAPFTPANHPFRPNPACGLDAGP
jgi:EB module